MRMLSRGLPAVAGLAALVCLLAGIGGAGEEKEAVWKPVMPFEAYKALLKRSIKTIEDNIDSKDKKALTRAQVGAVRAAADALSTKGDPGHLEAVHSGALLVAERIRDGKDLREAKRMAERLPRLAGVKAAKPSDFPKYLDVADLMNMYRPQKKGGEGLAEALKFTGPLKNQNGVEELVRYLAKKKPAAAALEKGAEDLTLLAYQMAADGSLTATFAKEQKKDPAAWRELALAQRDAAVRLAGAAAKRDAAAVHEAATALDAACTKCHDKFRKH